MTLPVRLLPSYAGSKSHWISRLQHLSGRNMVELFAGTGSISMNLANNALLNELDPQLHTILSRYDELIVPEVFTREDYYAVRGRQDWWRYAYYLSAMAFSGLFRYSKNGFNAQHKGGTTGKSARHESMSLRSDYEKALQAYERVAPTVVHGSYLDVTDEQIQSVGQRPVVILDPPYENTQTPYNDKNGTLDYKAYWDKARELASSYDLIIFDKASNLERAGYDVHGYRTMKMNGAGMAEREAVCFVTEGVRPERGWV